MTTRWRALADHVRDVGDERPHIEHLRARVDVHVAQEQLEREIVREMAAALGRSAEKVVAALARLATARAELDAAVDDATRAEAAARFNAFRVEALRARHELLIHREAVGIRRNDVLEIEYPIPASVTVEPRDR